MSIQAGDRLPSEIARAARGDVRYQIFYFMRTSDCAVCRGHLRRLVALAPVLAQAGAAVVVLVPEEAAPAWASGLPYPVAAGRAAYLAAGFGRTLGAIQQSGTIVADGAGVILDVRRATLPFQSFDERALLGLLGLPADAAARAQRRDSSDAASADSSASSAAPSPSPP